MLTFSKYFHLCQVNCVLTPFKGKIKNGVNKISTAPTPNSNADLKKPNFWGILKLDLGRQSRLLLTSLTSWPQPYCLKSETQISAQLQLSHQNSSSPSAQKKFPFKPQIYRNIGVRGMKSITTTCSYTTATAHLTTQQQPLSIPIHYPFNH